MGVLITGVHRSFTSMIAQWVGGLGVGMGAGDTFPVDSANPRGLHERTDVVAFNDRWLGTLGGSWWAPPAVAEQTWRSIDPRTLAADRLTLDYFAPDFNDWFVKDPRLSLLLPLWDRLALRKLPVIAAVRPHREVAVSLHVRSGTTFRRALALWLAYNQALFGHLGGRHSLVIDATAAMSEPAMAVKGIAAFCESIGLSVDEDRVSSVAEATDRALQRNRCDHLEGSAERLAKDLDDVYDALADRHLTPHWNQPETIQIPDWAQEALEEQTELWSFVTRNDMLATQVRCLEDEVRSLKASQDELQALIPPQSGRGLTLGRLGRALRRG